MKTLLFKIFSKSTCLGVFCFLIFACKKEAEYGKPIDNSFGLKIEKKYTKDLEELLIEVSKLEKLENIDSLQNQFKNARLRLKKIEPLLAFYNASAYKALNQPNLPTLHEDSNGVVEELPQGFQVLEELLFNDNPNLTEIKSITKDIKNTIILEKNNISLVFFKEYHFLWMLRASFIRIMSLGITGFDSPVIKHSIPETKAVLNSLKESIILCKTEFKSQELYNNWLTELQNACNMLDASDDFNTFNRYSFIKNHLHPLLKLWKQTKDDWKITFPFPTKINYEATSFFSNKTFNINSFKPGGSPELSDELINLGADLFNDKRLSSSSISCASCHIKDKYFTDGLPKAIGKNNKTLLRNTPSLYYAALQTNQFYDGRVANLENQIKEVIENKDEFHSDLNNLELVIEKDSSYTNRFKKLYKKGANQRNIRNAIANYIRSLAPFNSKFDRNISNLENTLSSSEINGFNLFMGKAQCATCHFAPIFNGTVPPNFSDTEFEVLGVPNSPVFKNATIDSDKGRYNLYGRVKKREYAFKTSTVRNIEKTAPYMHNGVFNTLEEVMEFYNLGGGHGIGIELENQTLPTDPLNLTDTEIKDLIDFMNSLTDSLTY